MHVAHVLAYGLLVPALLGGGTPAGPIDESETTPPPAPTVATPDRRGDSPAPRVAAHHRRGDSASAAWRTAAGLDPGERELVRTALDRFATVGLDVPDAKISFHDDTEPCHGHAGRYDPSEAPPAVHVCVADRGTVHTDLLRQRTLIHELAHAWEFAHLDDEDRPRLLTVLGATRWFANETPWEDRGGERFAETIVWGLYDQLRRPVKIDVSCSKLNADFQFITGHAPIGPVEQVCEPTTPLDPPAGRIGGFS